MRERTKEGKCKVCVRAKCDRWAAANPKRCRDNAAKWRDANREKVREAQRRSSKKWREKYPERSRMIVREHARACHRRKTGWTRELFAAAWMLQNGTCAICGVTMLPTGVALNSVAADHNHRTIQPRGLLCHGCNKGIGLLKDNPNVLRSAITYLERYL
jgi:hypothetical protein